MKRTFALVVSLSLFGTSAYADKPEEQEGSKDHPAVKRYPGSVLYENYEVKEFEKATLPVGEKNDKLVTEAPEGAVYTARYWFPDKASCTQILRNYENAFKAAGWKAVLSKGDSLPEGYPFNGQDTRWVTGIGELKTGGKIYATQTCYDHGVDENAWGDLVVVQTKAMEQKVEVADAMAEAIQKTGHVALYGITFATGKADITAESAKTLEQVAQLLETHPDWKLRVEGHTDNVGKSAANLELSKKRAASVKAWLVQHGKGVKAERLTSDGFGDTKPVADNGSEEGKAKNRRVELVKL